MKTLVEKSQINNPLADFDKWTPEQKELVKRTIAKGCTDDEVIMFAHVCAKKGLDPFQKQIYAMKVYDPSTGGKVMTIVVGIDGFRYQANRSGEYLGQEGPFWCGADGNWRDVWLKNEPPAAAKVRIFRKGIERPFTGIALYKEYVVCTNKGPNKRWATAPAHQLATSAVLPKFNSVSPLSLTVSPNSSLMCWITHDVRQSPRDTVTCALNCVPLLLKIDGIVDIQV